MATIKEIEKHKTTFKQWLSERGAEILDPTNQFEIIRFKTGKITCIAYRNQKRADAFMTPEFEEAWTAFRTGKSWRAVVPTKIKSMSALRETVFRRDGRICFYCIKPILSTEIATLEHLVSRAHGGPDHVSNLFPAHQRCNQEAGLLSAPEKIKIHTRAVIAKQDKENHHDRTEICNGTRQDHQDRAEVEGGRGTKEIVTEPDRRDECPGGQVGSA